MERFSLAEPSSLKGIIEPFKQDRRDDFVENHAGNALINRIDGA
jgi:hypothetical protein